MKWWYWLILELLIIFGIIAWIYFFPSEIEDDFAKGMIGFVLIYAIEECKNINRRKTMDYKEDMLCGECLKYAFCPVANHNTNHKACMKITTNYTIEQNTGENQIEGGVLSVSGSVSEKCYKPFEDTAELMVHFYKHFNKRCKTFEEPLIWVKRKDCSYDSRVLITGYDEISVFLEDVWIDLEELFEQYIFLDNSPIGKEE